MESNVVKRNGIVLVRRALIVGTFDDKLPVSIVNSLIPYCILRREFTLLIMWATSRYYSVPMVLGPYVTRVLYTLLSGLGLI